ncbi:unnamed protein product [Amoebophrya sp. A25]|nr:unnamed protein product [Amoebophrya sp. A25]|eukprot:GSA25T00009525001.1
MSGAPSESSSARDYFQQPEKKSSYLKRLLKQQVEQAFLEEEKAALLGTTFEHSDQRMLVRGCSSEDEDEAAKWRRRKERRKERRREKRREQMMRSSSGLHSSGLEVVNTTRREVALEQVSLQPQHVYQQTGTRTAAPPPTRQVTTLPPKETIQETHHQQYSSEQLRLFDIGYRERPPEDQPQAASRDQTTSSSSTSKERNREREANTNASIGANIPTTSTSCMIPPTSTILMLPSPAEAVSLYQQEAGSSLLLSGGRDFGRTDSQSVTSSRSRHDAEIFGTTTSKKNSINKEFSSSKKTSLFRLADLHSVSEDKHKSIDPAGAHQQHQQDLSTSRVGGISISGAASSASSSGRKNEGSSRSRFSAPMEHLRQAGEKNIYTYSTTRGGGYNDYHDDSLFSVSSRKAHEHRSGSSVLEKAVAGGGGGTSGTSTILNTSIAAASKEDHDVVDVNLLQQGVAPPQGQQAEHDDSVSSSFLGNLWNNFLSPTNVTCSLIQENDAHNTSKGAVDDGDAVDEGERSQLSRGHHAFEFLDDEGSFGLLSESGRGQHHHHLDNNKETQHQKNLTSAGRVLEELRRSRSTGGPRRAQHKYSNTSRTMGASSSGGNFLYNQHGSFYGGPLGPLDLVQQQQSSTSGSNSNSQHLRQQHHSGGSHKNSTTSVEQMYLLSSSNPFRTQSTGGLQPRLRGHKHQMQTNTSTTGFHTTSSGKLHSAEGASRSRLAGSDYGSKRTHMQLMGRREGYGYGRRGKTRSDGQIQPMHQHPSNVAQSSGDRDYNDYNATYGTEDEGIICTLDDLEKI